MKAWFGENFLWLTLAALIILPVLVVFYDASTLVNNLFIGMTANGLMPNSVLLETQAVMANWTLMDQMGFFLVIGVCFTSLVLAAFLNSSPLNFVYGFVGMIILTYVSFYVSNAAYSIVSNPTLIASAVHFPKMLSIAAELPEYVALFTGLYSVMILLRYYRVGPMAPLGQGE